MAGLDIRISLFSSNTPPKPENKSQDHLETKKGQTNAQSVILDTAKFNK
jgi:hypothetical protein